jgi:hypothetical protein
MKLQLDTKGKYEKELQIDTPCFRKVGHAFYKIFDTVALVVFMNDARPSIFTLTPEEDGSSLDYAINYGTEITADEFSEAFCEVHNKQAAIQLQKEPMPGVDLGLYDLKKLTA